VGHRLVVVIQELAKLVFEILHCREVSSPHHFPHDDPEHRFNLIEPGTVFGQIYEANAMRPIRQERTTARLIFQGASFPFWLLMDSGELLDQQFDEGS